MSAQVILGDCIEYMKTLPDASVDCCLTDPPYGTTSLAFDQTPIDWPAWWAEVHRVTKEAGVIVCFAADLFTVDLIQSNRKFYRYRLVWEKTMPTGFLDANRRPLRAHEDVLVFMRRMEGSTYNPQKVAGEAYTVNRTGQAAPEHYRAIPRTSPVYTDRHPQSIIRFKNGTGRGQENHPTQKPLDLMEWLVRTYTNPGDTVLDPFTGSGSTGCACVTLGREFIGAELDPTYHATAQRRIANAQPALLGVM